MSELEKFAELMLLLGQVKERMESAEKEISSLKLQLAEKDKKIEKCREALEKMLKIIGDVYIKQNPSDVIRLGEIATQALAGKENP